MLCVFFLFIQIQHLAFTYEAIAQQSWEQRFLDAMCKTVLNFESSRYIRDDFFSTESMLSYFSIEITFLI